MNTEMNAITRQEALAKKRQHYARAGKEHKLPPPLKAITRSVATLWRTRPEWLPAYERITVGSLLAGAKRRQKQRIYEPALQTP